jgi:hypothetical protein
LIVSIKSVRAAFAHCAFTGISGRHPGLLVTELEPRYRAAREDRLHRDRGRPRLRRPEAGARPWLSFTDRLVVALVHLWLNIPHAALAVVYGVDRVTITGAVGQVRPLLATRGSADGARNSWFWRKSCGVAARWLQVLCGLW